MMSENRKKRIRITVAMLSASLCFIFYFFGVNKIEAAAAGKTSEVSTDDASTDGNITSTLQLHGPEDGSIITEIPDDGITIPDGFTESDYIANDKTITAYQSQALPEDFYLFYAMNGNGEEGWYLYDNTEGTYQRYVLETSGQVTEEMVDTEDEGATTDSYDQKMTDLKADFKASNNFRLIIIGVMLVICVIMAGVIIYLFLTLRDLKSGIDYDESEDYLYEEEDEESDSEEITAKHSDYEDTEEGFYELEVQDDAANDDDDDENDDDENEDKEKAKVVNFKKKKSNKAGNKLVEKPDNKNGKRTEGINSIELTFIDLD